jgi:hypothetical protein
MDEIPYLTREKNRQQPIAATRIIRWWICGSLSVGLFLSGGFICVYILAFAMVVDPRLQGGEFWSAVIRRVFVAGGTGLMFSIGLGLICASLTIAFWLLRDGFKAWKRRAG